MSHNDELVRTAIAEQAGTWLVANDEASLDARDAAALAAWLKASPIHIEEFLGVSAVARDLKVARFDPAYSLEAILERARAEGGSTGEPLLGPGHKRVGKRRPRWFWVAGTVAACAVLSLVLLFIRRVDAVRKPAFDGSVTLHFSTRHGEQLTRRLSDNSVLHLDTDSAVMIRYGKTERLVTLTAGQADFEVTHEANRIFRVIAGAVEVVDLGTQFDVRLQPGSAVVTVVAGRVTVNPSTNATGDRGGVQLGAEQQLRVTAGEWPATPIAVDARLTTAWLRREIVFDHEPLERVVAEYNRYASKPIEIATPALRSLQITGVFATDDTEAFIAFLRSLKGVRVEVTTAQIRVSGN